MGILDKINNFIKSEFSEPVYVAKFILVLFIGSIYYFNSDVCTYFHSPNTKEWWEMNFKFQYFLYALMLQALIITPNRALRAVTSIVLMWTASDFLTLFFPHNADDIEARTKLDYVTISFSFILVILNYYTQSKLYNFIQKYAGKTKTNTR